MSNLMSLQAEELESLDAASENEIWRFVPVVVVPGILIGTGLALT